MQKIFDIRLDIKEATILPKFRVVTEDYQTNVLKISLVDGYKAVDLTGAICRIAFRRADGTTVQQTARIVDAEHGRIECLLMLNTIAVPGIVTAEVGIHDETNQTVRLTTAVFEFIVRKSLVDSSTVESQDDFSMLQDAINAMTAQLSDYIRQPGYGNTEGTDNGYAVSTTPAPTAYVDGMGIVIRAHQSNTGAATLNWNDLGAVPIVDHRGRELAAGKILSGERLFLRYSSTDGNFQLLGEGGEYGTATQAQVLEGYTIGTEDGVVSGMIPKRGIREFKFKLQDQIFPGGYYEDISIAKPPIDQDVRGMAIFFTGHTNTVNSVAVDSDGFVYSGSDDYTVKKITPTGAQVWSFTGHTSNVDSVVVDTKGFVYSGSADDTVKKIAPDGTQVWSFNGSSGDVNSVAVDANGFVYSGNDDFSVRKITSEGSQVWSFTEHTDSVRTVAVGLDGSVYSGSDDFSVRKITPEGSQVWSFTEHTDSVRAVAVDANGFVYSGSRDGTVKKITPDGNLVWSFTEHTSDVWAVVVGSDGCVYSGSRDGTVRKITPEGNQVWKCYGHDNDVNSVAVGLDGFIYSGSDDCTLGEIGYILTKGMMT